MDRIRPALFAASMLVVGAVAHAQPPFRELLPMEGYDGGATLPADWDEPGEFVVGRLMYPGGMGFRGGDWTAGGTSWAVDYPRGDRTLAALLDRFTRIDVRSVEQPVNPDSGDDIYYWPFLVVGLPGNWQLTHAQIEKIREYLLRGGFLYADSFFGTGDWIRFEQYMKRILPDRPIIDIPSDHPILHIVHDLSALPTTQIPHMNSLRGGRGGWLSDGQVPHWKGIEDDEGRLIVLIGHNNDTPDSWQWADDPRYPAESANLGLRLGVNIAAYIMTH